MNILGTLYRVMLSAKDMVILEQSDELEPSWGPNLNRHGIQQFL